MEALGVTVWSMIEQEADDGLAAAAHRFVDEVDQVVVMSPDKDMTQLFGNPKIIGYDRRKGLFIDAEGTREKFGVSPESIPDYLGLVGDTADGIPGLPGWGAKSTGAVLSEYGHIEHIPASEDEWVVKVRGAAKLAETLRTRMDDALLFRDLATLRSTAEIPQTLDELEWKGVRREAFEALCDELGFTGLRNRPSRYIGE
jgi:5'-3' exonuclease